MERKDLLKANASIFSQQGKALDKYAKKSVRCCVVGNPANTNCLILMKNAPSIPRENFSALTRLDHNRAKSMIAQRCKCKVDDVKNVIIWGNHSSTQYPDVEHAFIGTKSNTVRHVVNDDKWLNTEFIKSVQNRGAAVIAARKLSSAASAANAVSDHVRDWMLGSEEIVSMAIPSDGSYGIAPGVIYSYPVICSGEGRIKIVQGLSVNSFSRELMLATEKELREEADAAKEFM